MISLFTRLTSVLCLLILSLSPAAQTITCDGHTEQTPYSHEFDSGARWDLCWSISPASGLTLHNLHYGAPAQESVQVLATATLGQLAIHYHEDKVATQLIPTPGLGDEQHINDDRVACDGASQLISVTGDVLCRSVVNLNTLTSTRREHALRRHAITLTSASLINDRWVQQAWRLTEDGEIEPQIAVGGKINRLTTQPSLGSGIGNGMLLGSTANVVTTWRLDFAIDDTLDDLAEVYEFVPSDDTTRDMSVSQLDTETVQQVNRQRFRGWLIRDGNRASSNQLLQSQTLLAQTTQHAQTMGYYLDPLTSGFDNPGMSAASDASDVVITRTSSCEQFASHNQQIHANCGSSLDEFVNGETLSNGGLTLWYTLTRTMKPTADDYPFWPVASAQFKVVPFDWTDQSTFRPEPR